MNIIELIKDAAFFGGHIPNERLDECRYFFDNVIEKQCIIPEYVISNNFTTRLVQRIAKLHNQTYLFLLQT